jgi:hypothetical protein
MADGRRVGVLGAAFKPDCDDIRDSPALDVAAAVHRLGAQVTVYDPEAMGNARRLHPDLKYADSAVEAARDTDVMMLLTEWQEFRDADPEIIAKVVTRRNVVDGRHALDLPAPQPRPVAAGEKHPDHPHEPDHGHQQGERVHAAGEDKGPCLDDEREHPSVRGLTAADMADH